MTLGLSAERSAGPLVDIHVEPHERLSEVPAVKRYPPKLKRRDARARIPGRPLPNPPQHLRRRIYAACKAFLIC